MIVMDFTYPGVKLSKSIDLVSISPLRFRYSRIMPGGWNLSKNLLSFIFISILLFLNYIREIFMQKNILTVF